MINSFMNALLPKDEYKRLSLLYFFAEAALILLMGTFLLAVLQLFFVEMKESFDLILLCLMFFIIIYPAARYVFSGIEYDSVMDKSSYQKARKKGTIQTLGTGIVFFIIYLIWSFIKGGEIDILSLIVLPIFFTFFYGLFTMLSLKKSYNKNKELDDQGEELD